MTKITALLATIAIALTAAAAPAGATTGRELKVTLKRVCAADGATKVRIKVVNPNSAGGEKYVSYEWAFSDTGVSTTTTWLNPGQVRRDSFRLTGDREADVAAGPGYSPDGSLLNRHVRTLDC